VSETAKGIQRKREASLRRFTTLSYAGDLSALDAKGKSLLWRSADLGARLMLNDRTMPEFDAKNFEGCCTLVHAERYLADRLAYELEPWPKGMIKDETINPLPNTCPHCTRIIIEPNWCSLCETPFCSLNCTLDHKHDGGGAQ